MQPLRIMKTIPAALAISILGATLTGACTSFSDATAQENAMPNIEAKKTAQYGQSEKFTSNISMTDLSFGGETYLGTYIQALLQGVQVLHFDKSPDKVWDWVHSGNATWSLQIETLSWDHSASETPGKLGMGSVRRCDFVGASGTAYERVYNVEENRLFAYDIDPERSTAPLPIKDFFVVWTLEDKGADGTLVVARMYFHEAQDAGGQISAGVSQALGVDFKNFANVYGGTYVTM